MPGRREAHAISWMALAAGVILCSISVALGLEGKTFLGRPLGGDFVQFYTVGTILNHDAPARIYDLALANSLQHATVNGMPQTQMLFFVHAPFIAPLFRPFALLPYAWAYVAWLGFSALVYVAGLTLLFRAVGLDSADRKTGFLLALSSTPFLFETWIGGQVSVVVFFIWVLLFWCLKKDRAALAGFVLAAALFKPTLVALPVLMLVVGRRWRIVAGFVAGAIAMAALSVGAVGRDGCRAWFAALTTEGNIVASQGAHPAKCVDLRAFCHLVFAHWPVLADIAAIALAAAALGWLGAAWWRLDPTVEPAAQATLWAATLCFSLLVSPYAPIYDSILVVCALALAATSCQALDGWPLLLYLVPWVTQSFAEFLHLQLLTLALAAFALGLLETTRKSGVSHSKPRQEESTIPRGLPLRATGRFQVRSRGLP